MGLFLLSWSRRVFEVEKVASKLSHREWGGEALPAQIPTVHAFLAATLPPVVVCGAQPGDSC